MPLSSTIPPPSVLPTQYCPQRIEEFFGPARLIAKRLTRSAEMCLATGAPAAHLLVGPSGTGKSALAAFALQPFQVNVWNTTEVFGSDLTVERVREIALSLRLTSLYPGYRAWVFNEIDRCTKEARDRLLEIVGDRNQPNQTVILATSNMSVTEFDKLEKTEDARGRFTGRFQVHEVPGPEAHEIAPLLTRWLPEPVATEYARLAATGANGQPITINCRALLKDVATYLQDL